MFRQWSQSAERWRNARWSWAIAFVLIDLCVPYSLAQTQASTTNSGDAGAAPILSAQLPASAVSGGNGKPAAVPSKSMRLYLRAVHELHRHAAASAEKDALRAVHLDASFADAYALAATALLAERKFHRAQVEARNAVAMDAGDEKAWLVLATADNYLSEYTGAVVALQHLSQQDMTTWQAAYQRARAEAGEGHGPEMLQWANIAALTAPEGFAPLHLLRASALLGVDEYSAAADELEIYLQSLDQDASQRAELTQELGRLRAIVENGSRDVKPAERNALAN